MAFDTTIRNELQKMVGRARDLLVEEFTAQCQGVYGIQPDGSILKPEALGHLSEEDRTRAQLLRDRVQHLAAGIAGTKKHAEAVARMVREQAFTVLNRLCALRMCEERGLVQECVRSGYDSKGFRLYDQAANKLGGETFWEKAEERIYAALQSYAEKAEHGEGYQRRLFADDAARGFAFIDLCRKRYDVVVMNPPFGEPVETTIQYLDEQFAEAKHDVAIGMIERCLSILSQFGSLGAITTRTPLYNSSSSSWRKKSLFFGKSLFSCLDLGGGVLDAMVEVAAYVLTPSRVNESSLFIQLAAEPAQSKGDAAREELSRALECAPSNRVFIKDIESLKQLPNAPLAYWLPDSLIRCFNEYKCLRQSEAEAWVGLQTSNDERFLRLWWEIAPEFFGWRPFSKGGEASPYLADVHLMVNWHDDGKEMKAYHDWLNQTGKSTPGNGPRRDFPFYFEPGLTWVYRTDRFHVQPLPENCITSTRGPGIYSKTRLRFLLGYLNSSIADVLVKVLLGKHKQPQFDIDDVNAIPTPSKDDSRLCDLALLAWSARARQMLSYEEYNAGCAGLVVYANALSNIAVQYAAFSESRNDAIETLREIQREINSRSNSLLGVSEHELESIKEILFDWTDFGVRVGDVSDYSHRLLSFCLGCILGRWDIRFATGEKPAPELPDPFAPLPACPPGQLQNEQGLPITREDVVKLKEEGRWNYPIEIPWDGILVDDPGHPLDIEARVQQVLQVIWKDRWEAIEHEACEILGVRILRDYFRNFSGGKKASFFADHLKRYSKSRRKAPIYWPLSTDSGSYTLWIYYHRLTDQTLYTCVNDHIDPKFKEIEADIQRLRSTGQPDRKAQKQVDDLVELERELKAMREELLRVARLPYRPDQNDGVLITAAPLWRLFRYKSWQKDLKKCWEELEAGKYDWAHLALAIWPERVREVCKRDKSIAIAHGLEDLFDLRGE